MRIYPRDWDFIVEHDYPILRNDDGYVYIGANNELHYRHHEGSILADTILTSYIEVLDRITPNTWLCDSGASSDMKINTDGMINLRPLVKTITVGNKDEMKTTYIGDFVGDILTKDNKLKRVVRKDVLVVPELWVNLWSLSKDIGDDTCEVNNEGNTFFVVIDGKKIEFDRSFKAGSGRLYGIETIPVIPEGEAANIQEVKQKFAIETLHAALGHPSEEVSRKTAKLLNI